MELEGHEVSHQHPKRGKPRNHTHIPSTLSKDSVMANPTLPEELIAAILVHDDYKEVALFCEIGNWYVDAQIYSLKSDSWRTLDDFLREIVHPSSGKLVNEKLHWVTTIVDGSRGIMSLDLVYEKCRKVEHPCYGEEIFLLKLGALGSDLSVLCSCSSYKRTDVWVMKEYGVKESWTKIYTIECLSCLLSPPFCMSIEGEILHVFGSTLTRYNPEDDSMRYLEVTSVDDYLTNFDGYPKAELYIESLVCPVLQNEPMA